VLLMEGEIFEAAPGVEMLNTGYSNETPWKTPREYPEEFVREHVEGMTTRLRSPGSAIFNIHVPPFDSGLDTAPMLDENFVVQTSMGAQLSAPVGSTAVRAAIERHQPVLSLHGHIHESGGTARLGRTVAINPGSEYSEGVLRGALATFSDGELVRHQSTSG
jgi:Icc-related predicted phosphoesterase